MQGHLLHGSLLIIHPLESITRGMLGSAETSQACACGTCCSVFQGRRPFVRGLSRAVARVHDPQCLFPFTVV